MPGMKAQLAAIGCLAGLLLLAGRGLGAPAGPRDDAAKTAARTLRVTVLGPDERPLAGARIHASVWTKEPFKANRDFVCDANGKATVELPKTMDILRLWASKERHASLFAN